MVFPPKSRLGLMKSPEAKVKKEEYGALGTDAQDATKTQKEPSDQLHTI
jgi:hypothetical protein